MDVHSTEVDREKDRRQAGDDGPAAKEHSAGEDYVVVPGTNDHLLQEFKKGLCEWMKPIVERLTSLEAAVSDCKALLRSGTTDEGTEGREEKFKSLADRVKNLESNVDDLKTVCGRQVTETSSPAACTKGTTHPAVMAENDSGSESTPEVVPGASPLPKSRSEAAAVPSDENKDRQPIDEKDSGNVGTQKLVSATSSLPKPGSEGAAVPSDVYTDHQSMAEKDRGNESTQVLVSAASPPSEPGSEAAAVPNDENKVCQSVDENGSVIGSTQELVSAVSSLPKPASKVDSLPSDDNKDHQPMAERDQASGGTRELVSVASAQPKPGNEATVVPSEENKDRPSMGENSSGIGSTQEYSSASSPQTKPGCEPAAVPSDENKDRPFDFEQESDEDSSVAILVANFDVNMRGEAADLVWEQLTSVAGQVLGKEVRATVRHYDTYVDSIAAAKEDLTKVAEKLKLGLAEGDSPNTEGKLKKQRVIGALMTANTNRLAIFHSEQSNTLFPVVKTLREQTEKAIVLVVSQDFDSKAEPLRWWSPSLQLLLESQVPMRKLNGDEGLLLGLFHKPHFSQARALAAFLSNDPVKEGEVLLPHFPKSQRSHASNAGIEKFLQDLADVPECGLCKAVAADQHKSRHPIRNWVTTTPPPLKPMAVQYRLFCQCTGGNPEMPAQMEEFKSRCLPTNNPNRRLPGKKADLPVLGDNETCYIAIVFVAAEGHADYRQRFLEGCRKDGFDHCVVAKMFDKSYLDPNWAADRQRHLPRKDKDVTVVSWFSLPSDVVAEAVLQATRVAVQMKFGKDAMDLTATHGDWHVTLFSGV